MFLLFMKHEEHLRCFVAAKATKKGADNKANDEYFRIKFIVLLVLFDLCSWVVEF